MRFQMPLAFSGGCCSRICRAKWTLRRQKSISSQAESISAWYAVLDWPSIVAALSFWRHGPESSSAALSRTEARSSKDIERQAGAASLAAVTASCASSTVALRIVPRTLRRAWGWRTSIFLPPPMTRLPAIVCGSSQALAAQVGQRRLELLALGTAGRVVQRRLVGGGGNVADCIHYGGGS